MNIILIQKMTSDFLLWRQTGIKNKSTGDKTKIVLIDLLTYEIDDQPFPINESKVQQIAESIENVGVIEAIIVVRNGDRYKILSGRHRYRACQML